MFGPFRGIAVVLEGLLEGWPRRAEAFAWTGKKGKRLGESLTGRRAGAGPLAIARSARALRPTRSGCRDCQLLNRTSRQSQTTAGAIGANEAASASLESGFTYVSKARHRSCDIANRVIGRGGRLLGGLAILMVIQMLRMGVMSCCSFASHWNHRN